MLKQLFPFLRWFPMSRAGMRADLMAGVTVALVLVPQSMAYAQLAGLPVVYGLYASFIPVIIASMWGSSSQLHTGTVAMLSLMSAAALIPFATPGSPGFIELSIMLAMMVGVLRLFLGIFSLGALVNLLSSPVIVGFTNAAALIIGLSQLNKVLGVPFPRTESYLADLWRVVVQIPDTHWPTLLFAAGAWILVDQVRKHRPKWPGVLIAVGVATIIAAFSGYENKVTVPIAQIADAKKVMSLRGLDNHQTRNAEITEQLAEISRKADALEEDGTQEAIGGAAELRSAIPALEFELAEVKREMIRLTLDLYHLNLYDNGKSGEQRTFSRLPEGAEPQGGRWRVLGVNEGMVTLSAGGNVVGVIPEGLPSLQVPVIQWDLILALLPAAMVMALIGFMEATSISKAIATTTGERVVTN